MALNSLKHEGAAGIPSASRICKPPTPIEPLSPCLAPLFGPEPSGVALDLGFRNDPYDTLISGRPVYQSGPVSAPNSVPATTSVLVSPIDTLASIALATSPSFHSNPHLRPSQASSISKLSNRGPSVGSNLASFAKPIPPFAPVDLAAQRSLLSATNHISGLSTTEYRPRTHSLSNPSDLSSSPERGAEPDNEAVFISHILLSLHNGNRDVCPQNPQRPRPNGLAPSRNLPHPVHHASNALSLTKSASNCSPQQPPRSLDKVLAPLSSLDILEGQSNPGLSGPPLPDKPCARPPPKSDHHSHHSHHISSPELAVKQECSSDHDTCSRVAWPPSHVNSKYPRGETDCTVSAQSSESLTSEHHNNLDSQCAPKSGAFPFPQHSLPPEPLTSLQNAPDLQPSHVQPKREEAEVDKTTVCAECHQIHYQGPHDTGLWVECSGCALWLHCPCAGFKTDREVRTVDKFFCRACQAVHGPTTYLRKSNRSKAMVDYARLNEGMVKANEDETQLEHQYVRRIKDGSVSFLGDCFPRLRPECATAEYLERCSGFKEPTLIPAEWNPRPIIPGTLRDNHLNQSASPYSQPTDPTSELDEHFEYEYCLDEGQDRIGMIIPQGLSVRRVADLYGPDEKLDVINVMSQEADKRWNLAQWADYYESPEGKPIRNVISLEVSWSKLGRLIRRPQLVRELDLQDSVWPPNEPSPKVQLYCLMSVADAYTDFHIDFGGSSVYYHIVKGRKTFFFIPPSKKNLKKYEEWNLSPSQNWTWFPDLVDGECYRMDLYEGDTALIPSGWIHAVWTPVDSLVIGGNFLTRLSFGMQFVVADIEKNTKVPRKFRYPHFQKVHWYTALRYLESDPLPDSVKALLESGQTFNRDLPVYLQPHSFGHNSTPGVENYNARYYAKSEILDLPEVVRYLFRTVIISLANLEGVSIDSKNSVSKAIPKLPGHLNALQIVQRFAQWVCWKRGNERIPQWAHSNWNLEDAIESCGGDRKSRKVTQAMLKKFDRLFLEPTIEGIQNQTQVQQLEPVMAPEKIVLDSDTKLQAPSFTSTSVEVSLESNPSSRSCHTQVSQEQGSEIHNNPEVVSPVLDSGLTVTGTCEDTPGKARTDVVACPGIDSSLNGSPLAKRTNIGPRRFACDTCRKRRIRCRHRDHISQPGLEQENMENETSKLSSPAKTETGNDSAFCIQTSPSASILSEIKKIRHRACASCRISKRRCIHDENGNFSPHKAADPIDFSRDGIESLSRRACSGDQSVLETDDPSLKAGLERRVVSAMSGCSLASLANSNVLIDSPSGPPKIGTGIGLGSCRRASTSAIPSKSPRIRISSVKRSAPLSPPEFSELKRTPKRRAKEVEESDEMKSERLARQLAAEEWSLRRRVRRRC